MPLHVKVAAVCTGSTTFGLVVKNSTFMAVKSLKVTARSARLHSNKDG